MMVNRIDSLRDLKKIKSETLPTLASRFLCSADQLDDARIAIQNENRTFQIGICGETGCTASHSDAVKVELERQLVQNDLHTKVDVFSCGCLGICDSGPLMVVYPGGYLYTRVTEAAVEEIIAEHILKGKVVTSLLYRDRATKSRIPFLKDISFYSNQEIRVLRNKSVIDGSKLDQYIARDGFFGFAKAVLTLSPQETVQMVLDSGLRGRGGAGFPTGKKWQLCLNEKSDKKYILCNADEGDPGAFMDRSLIEADPFALLEGMMIGAYAIGANEGYIYCRAEYPLALDRLEKAIRMCEKFDLLGENILGSKFSLQLKIARGSGAFVCGEETALIHSIEGKRGEPRPRPPYPIKKGLWGKPTVLNNVETYCNIPLILQNGVDWYREVGTENSPGTKIFALTGKLNNVGLIEVPIGTPLGNLIYDIGGGILKNKQFKAAQIGGPSGGCIPKEYLNIPLDYESLKKLGAMMGSGGLVVMDEDTCMVDVARFFLDFVQDESCGKCTPCRVGSKRMMEILERICSGKGKLSDIDQLISMGETIQQASLCGLGQSAPNPVLSTIRFFREEYEQHIKQHRCEAGLCPELVRAPCQTACPANVDVPGFVALVGEKRYGEALRLHRERNPFASVCARVCFHTCEQKCRRAMLDEAVSIRGTKRFMVDQEVTIQLPEMRENKDNAGRKIAIVGAGPAGLSCAYFLARLGYKPTVFESQLRPGGMLVQAIPSYRLPREQVALEVRMIERMGVDILTDHTFGADFGLDELRRQGYEAVFIAAGASKGKKLDIPGIETEGVVDSLEMLRTYNERGLAKMGQQVVVIGGGNAAIDAARTALRLGAESVTVVYRRTREEMPAYSEEIDAALEEGVVIKTLSAPIEVLQVEGRVTGLRCMDVALGSFDRTGRRRPQESDHTFVVATDRVIVAVGQSIPKSLSEPLQSVCAQNGKVRIDFNTGQTRLPWLFAGGDVVRGPSSVVTAIADGERAAVGIDEFLTNKNHAFWRKERKILTNFNADHDPVDFVREGIPVLDIERRKYNFEEVEKSWSEAVALRQAKRCLRCEYGKETVKE